MLGFLRVRRILHTTVREYVVHGISTSSHIVYYMKNNFNRDMNTFHMNAWLSTAYSSIRFVYRCRYRHLCRFSYPHTHMWSCWSVSSTLPHIRPTGNPLPKPKIPLVVIRKVSTTLTRAASQTSYLHHCRAITTSVSSAGCLTDWLAVCVICMCVFYVKMRARVETIKVRNEHSTYEYLGFRYIYLFENTWNASWPGAQHENTILKWCEDSGSTISFCSLQSA